jgi:hypothetical protein
VNLENLNEIHESKPVNLEILDEIHESKPVHLELLDGIHESKPVNLEILDEIHESKPVNPLKDNEKIHSFAVHYKSLIESNTCLVQLGCYY